ncbi:hypothetical protein T06_13209 [Trichinella sp. T6]|nr:hypothetical protein T06_13209 [Trichinella sp. T6]
MKLIPETASTLLYRKALATPSPLGSFIALGSYQLSQGDLHEPLKGSRGVAQPKKHHLQLVQAIWGGENSLLSVPRLYFQLTVSTGQIQR